MEKQNRFGPGVELTDPAFIHPTALIYGNVRIGRGSSMWPYSVIRAEVFGVNIGEYTNIQDFVMIHIGDKQETRIGSYCSLTHRCTVHGAVIEDNCLIGIGAVILEGCVIGENSVVAPGSLLKEGTVIPPNSIVAGSPARAVMKRDSRAAGRFYADMYHRNARAYAEGNHRPLGNDDFLLFAKNEMARLERDINDNQ
jgi:carbonic anhydrase/acetyltransferase-like protein (isoleucine patch superfamily)